MKNPRLLPLWAALAVLIMYVYITWASRVTRRQGEADYLKLHVAAIHGVISRLGVAHHETSFTVDSQTFIFSPVYIPGKDFDGLAAEGDSIYKDAFRDTLTLVKSGQHYRFHFRK